MGARIGWGEFVIVLIIALVVLGPEKLPQAGRALGKAVRSVKKYIHDAAEELEIDELDELKSDVRGIRQDLQAMGRNLEKSVNDELDGAEKDLAGAGEAIRAAVEKEPTPEAGVESPADGETQEEA